MNIYPPKPASSGKATMIAMASAAQSSGGSSSVTITSPPTTGTVGTALNLAGTVSPTATAVQVGLSTSNTTAPTSWTAATVSGTAWTAALTPSTAGTFYIWAEQTASPSVQAVSAAITISASSGSIALTSPPTSGLVGSSLTITGTVSPNATAVQVGLSTTNTTAPTSFTAATVTGGTWTVTLTPATAGTYYIWAEQTATPATKVISSSILVSSANTFSVISGSGNGGLTGATITTGYSATDFGTHIAVGATDVGPNINISGGSGTPATAKFWWDTNNTGTTVSSSYGNSAAYSGGNFYFYSFGTGGGTPKTIPATPSAGTYYGKYAVYDSSNTLLGVITTSAITIS